MRKNCGVARQSKLIQLVVFIRTLCLNDSLKLKRHSFVIGAFSYFFTFSEIVTSFIIEVSLQTETHFDPA